MKRTLCNMQYRASISTALVLLVLSLGTFWPVVSQYAAVDRCLDAGGNFDYAKHQCDFAAVHPYVPIWDGYRSYLLVAFALVCLAIDVLARRNNYDPMLMPRYVAGSIVGAVVCAVLYVLCGVVIYEMGVHFQPTPLYHPSMLERIYGQFAYQLVFVFVYAWTLIPLFLILGRLAHRTAQFLDWPQIPVAAIVGACSAIAIAFEWRIPFFLNESASEPHFFSDWWFFAIDGALGAIMWACIAGRSASAQHAPEIGASVN